MIFGHESGQGVEFICWVEYMMGVKFGDWGRSGVRVNIWWLCEVRRYDIRFPAWVLLGSC